MSKVGVARAAAGAVLALALGSCAIVDSVDPRYDSINRSTTKARNESILLNIVRASQNVPLNFIAFSRVSGTTTAAVGSALPSFVIGGNPVPTTIQRDATLGSSTLNSSMNASGSFDITVLESKDFYTALLSPIDLVTLNYFLHQGYPRALLFWLFTDSVRVTIGGVTREFRNLPGDEEQSCNGVGATRRCFRDLVADALATGLSVETQVDQKSGGGKESKATYARMCYDRVLEERTIKEYGREITSTLTFAGAHEPRCGRWKLDTKKIGTDTLTFEWVGTPRGTVRYEIITRSTFGVYQYLGRILSQHLTNIATIQVPRAAEGEGEDDRILAVSNDSSNGCFVDLNFEGDFYCVPKKGAENTKRIFSLLAQLLALKLQASDLAITPTVRVTP